MPYKSTYADITIPDVDLYSLIFEREKLPFPEDHPIFIDELTRKTYTYAAIKSAVLQFGQGLKYEFRWRKSDVLCIFSTNNIDYGTICWGTHWVGGVVTPANPGYTVDELTFQLKSSKSRCLVTTAELLPVAAPAAAAAGIPKSAIILIGPTRAQGYRHYTSILDPSAVTHFRRPKLTPSKDLAFIAYSSGTTGVPKGVMLTHTNLVTNLLQYGSVEEGYTTWKEDRVVAFLPFFHAYGLTCIMHHAIFRGLTTVVMPRFDLPKLLGNVQEWKITYLYAVPPVVLLLAKHPLIDKYDLKSLKYINSGAAPLTSDLIHAVHTRLGVPIKQGYGLSETSPVTHILPVENALTHPGGVGRLLPNMEVKYVDEQGNEVPRGERGEVCVRGGNVMIGYLNNVEATKGCIDKDGFFHTGDIGQEDADGILFIVDRVKELIKYKGFQVAPAELEGLLLGHPEVDDVAVAGVYDEGIASEVPRAYVVLRAGTERSDAKAVEIQEWLAKKVANYKRLRGGVKWVDAIPKSASGKILRRVIREEIRKEGEERKEKELNRAKL
ncbi:acetyl-CoA synthetase-like protein [Ascobolus immersus RN42]|uniref:Acetyl-CoA synthetase-like protein n=1 Tax=Ascobolus immersus RN42 TaxID=1160509 RepID=A0A3N4IC08_ASCIM|nr:acetyl-CoA synthetase-like protein [Ascobolus immersus RN42]